MWSNPSQHCLLKDVPCVTSLLQKVNFVNTPSVLICGILLILLIKLFTLPSNMMFCLLGVFIVFSFGISMYYSFVHIIPMLFFQFPLSLHCFFFGRIISRYFFLQTIIVLFFVPTIVVLFSIQTIHTLFFHFDYLCVIFSFRLFINAIFVAIKQKK